MKCSKAEQLISPYIDGELEAEGKTLFEAHLRECAACRGSLEDVRRTHTLFAHAEQYRAPFGFAARIMANVTAPEKETFAVSPLLVKFAEVVVVLVMITVGVISGRFLTNSIMGQRTGNIASSFSLEIFEPAPPGSLGGAYLALMEARNEK